MKKIKGVATWQRHNEIEIEERFPPQRKKFDHHY